jgi:serine phosphatase RsbU (regulator of sigma subunit)
MKKKAFLLLNLLIIIFSVFAVDDSIEDLQKKLSGAKGEERSAILESLAGSYYNSNPAKSIELYDSCALMAEAAGNRDRMMEMRLNSAKVLVMVGRNDTIRNFLLPEFEKWMDDDVSNKVSGLFYNLKSISQFYEGLHDSALINWDQAIKYFSTINDSINIYNCQLYKARVYNVKGDYQKSIDLYFEILKLFENRLDVTATGTIYNDLGATFDNWGNHDRALEYYAKALECFKETKNYMMMTALLTNMGETYKVTKDYKRALECNLEAYNLIKNSGNKYFISVIFINLGESYNLLKDYKKGMQFSQQALDLFTEMGNVEDIARAWSTICQSYIGLKEYKKALNAVETSQKAAVNLRINDLRLRNLQFYTELYKTMGQPYKALEITEKYIALKDSIFTSEKSKTIEELQTKYETGKKEQDIILQQTEIEKNKRKVEILIISLIAVFLIVILGTWAYILKWRSNRRITEHRDEIEEKNKALTQQKEEILSQSENIEKARNEISVQKRIIENTHNELLHSINYAAQIQEAVFPSDKELVKILPHHFLFFQPRDVVSGDFYWARKQDDQLLIVVGDCTGHGIPGAMMSMYAISLINELFVSQRIIHPEELLENLRQHLKSEINVKQSMESNPTDADVYYSSHIKDGIDMSICFIDLKSRKLEFAGANNPMYIISGCELTELQPVNNPVGIFIREKPFARVECDLKENDTVYMFTDGYTDQFGPNDTGKFNTTRFKDLLKEISGSDMNHQKDVVVSSFEQWKRNSNQTDDITVLGIMI